MLFQFKQLLEVKLLQEPKKNPKEEKEDENTIKLTVEFYRQYKILDFNDQWSGEYAEDKPYNVEIYYYITIKGTDEVEDSKNWDETKKAIIKTKKFWRQTNKCDKNKNIIEQGKKEYRSPCRSRAALQGYSQYYFQQCEV